MSSPSPNESAAPDALAARALRRLLDGHSPNGVQPSACGPWAEHIEALYQAHGEGGADAARRVFFERTQASPALAELVAGGPPAGEAEPPGLPGDSEWPKPTPLPSECPAVEMFSEDLLPEAFRGWVMDVADRMQVPPDYPAAGIMAAAAAAVGRRIGLRPKQRDGWLVVPVLWSMIVGRPGFMKTPALQDVLRPLHRLQAEAIEDYQRQQADYERDRLINEALASKRKEKIKAAAENEKGKDELRALVEKCEVEEPTCTRYVVNDATVEKMGEILKENPNGVLLFRDELSGFLAGLDKKGQEGARKFYLEAWTGTGSYTFDRIGRGTVHISKVCLSILGTIQPGVLRSHMEGTTSGGAADDGLMQRFQLTVWPDAPGDFENVDRWPNGAARDRAFGAISSLVNLRPEKASAEADDDERRGIPFLRYDPEAQEHFNAWRATLERRIRSGSEPAAFTSHLAKYRSLVPALSLLCHLAGEQRGPVSAEACKRATRWAAYLESHARRVYGAAAVPETAAARELAGHIRSKDLSSPFTPRDVYRKGWTGLDDKAAAEGAIGVLEHHGWVRQRTVQTAGRPRTEYHVNPKAKDTPEQA